VFIEQNSSKIFRTSRKIFVKPIIVFTNEEAVLNIKNPSVPVKRPEDLCDYIERDSSADILQPKEIVNLENLLSAYTCLR
jgi:hypothetical protein